MDEVVYAKKVETTDPRFKNRSTRIASPVDQRVIPVPDTSVLCNGCNKNIYPEPGYLVYLGKEDLDDDRPYDFYCKGCLKECFPGARIVDKEVAMAKCPNCKKELKYLCASAEVTRIYHVHLEDGILRHTFSGVIGDVPIYVYTCPICNTELSFTGFDQVSRFLKGEQVI